MRARVYVKYKKYARHKRQLFLSVSGLDRCLGEFNVLIDLYPWNFSCRLTLSHPYVNSFEVPHEGWFLRTYDCSNRERKREVSILLLLRWHEEGAEIPPISQPSGWTYTTGNVERHTQDSPKSNATVHASGVGRMGVAQLLSAVKPANRGSQTPLRTAARSYTFDVSLPPSRYPVASNLPFAQFIARRTWSNRFLVDRFSRASISTSSDTEFVVISLIPMRSFPDFHVCDQVKLSVESLLSDPSLFL